MQNLGRLAVLTLLSWPLFAGAQGTKSKTTALPQKTLAETLGQSNPRPVIDKAPSEIKQPIEGAAADAAAPAPTTVEVAAPAPKPAPVLDTPKISGKKSRTKKTKPVELPAPLPTPTPESVTVNTPEGPVTETQLLVTTSALSAETTPTEAKVRNEVIADTKGPAKTEVSKQEIKEASYPGSAPSLRYYGRHHQMNLAFGYVHSKWNDVAGALKDGSLEIRLSGSREFGNGFESELGVSALFLNSTSGGENSNGAFAIDIGGRWMPWDDSTILPYAGMHASFGTYRIWSVLSESPNLVTYRKHSSGVLFGLVPALGLRLRGSDRLSLDVEANYRGYFDNPGHKVGGWGALVRMGFRR